MRVFAIDPGTTQSAYCIIDADSLRPIRFGILKNEELLDYIRHAIYLQVDIGCIEMLQSYGNLIGRDVLETAVWIGRFYERLMSECFGKKPALVYRMQEKVHICHDSRAKDANIRRALIDRFCTHDLKNGRGTKDNPDWFHGFKKDIWAAYAVGLTFIETKGDTT